jgi:ABC-type nickel/cobalt efflux system permease component RcnA
MPVVFMCIYMLVIGEGRERETEREGEVDIYKYTHAQREYQQRERHIEKHARTHARTHARDIKTKREACAHAHAPHVSTAHNRVRARLFLILFF